MEAVLRPREGSQKTMQRGKREKRNSRKSSADIVVLHLLGARKRGRERGGEDRMFELLGISARRGKGKKKKKKEGGRKSE